MTCREPVVAGSDDICCAEQASEIECKLTADLAHLSKYCPLWHLKPITTKTVTSSFHLRNTDARRELNIFMNGVRLKHDPNPVYLGITVDRTLLYKEHLSRSAAKLRSRNNLIS